MSEAGACAAVQGPSPRLVRPAPAEGSRDQGSSSSWSPTRAPAPAPIPALPPQAPLEQPGHEARAGPALPALAPSGSLKRADEPKPAHMGAPDNAPQQALAKGVGGSEPDGSPVSPEPSAPLPPVLQAQDSKSDGPSAGVVALQKDVAEDGEAALKPSTHGLPAQLQARPDQGAMREPQKSPPGQPGLAELAQDPQQRAAMHAQMMPPPAPAGQQQQEQQGAPGVGKPTYAAQPPVPSPNQFAHQHQHQAAHGQPELPKVPNPAAPPLRRSHSIEGQQSSSSSTPPPGPGLTPIPLVHSQSMQQQTHMLTGVQHPQQPPQLPPPAMQHHRQHAAGGLQPQQPQQQGLGQAQTQQMQVTQLQPMAQAPPQQMPGVHQQATPMASSQQPPLGPQQQAPQHMTSSPMGHQMPKTVPQYQQQVPQHAPMYQPPQQQGPPPPQHAYPPYSQQPQPQAQHQHQMQSPPIAPVHHSQHAGAQMHPPAAPAPQHQNPRENYQQLYYRPQAPPQQMHPPQVHNHGYGTEQQPGPGPHQQHQQGPTPPPQQHLQHPHHVPRPTQQQQPLPPMHGHQGGGPQQQHYQQHPPQHQQPQHPPQAPYPSLQQPGHVPHAPAQHPAMPPQAPEEETSGFVITLNEAQMLRLLDEMVLLDTQRLILEPGAYVGNPSTLLNLTTIRNKVCSMSGYALPEMLTDLNSICEPFLSRGPEYAEYGKQFLDKSNEAIVKAVHEAQLAMAAGSAPPGPQGYPAADNMQAPPNFNAGPGPQHHSPHPQMQQYGAPDQQGPPKHNPHGMHQGYQQHPQPQPAHQGEHYHQGHPPPEGQHHPPPAHQAPGPYGMRPPAAPGPQHGGPQGFNQPGQAKMGDPAYGGVQGSSASSSFFSSYGPGVEAPGGPIRTGGSSTSWLELIGEEGVGESGGAPISGGRSEISPAASVPVASVISGGASGIAGISCSSVSQPYGSAPCQGPECPHPHQHGAPHAHLQQQPHPMGPKPPQGVNTYMPPPPQGPHYLQHQPPPQLPYSQNYQHPPDQYNHPPPHSQYPGQGPMAPHHQPHMGPPQHHPMHNTTTTMPPPQAHHPPQLHMQGPPGHPQLMPPGMPRPPMYQSNGDDRSDSLSPASSTRSRVAGRRCEVCAVIKKAGCGTDAAHFRCLKRKKPENVPEIEEKLGRLGELGDEERVTVWNPAEGRKLSGQAAPMMKNLAGWLANHPGWEAHPKGAPSSSHPLKRYRESSVETLPTPPLSGVMGYPLAHAQSFSEGGPNNSGLVQGSHSYLSGMPQH